MNAAPRLCYAIASPDITTMPIAWTGETRAICEELARLGYGGVEVQVRDPDAFDVAELFRTLDGAGLTLTGLSTGPVTSEGLVLTSADPAVRRAAVDRLKRIADVAAERRATVAIGSVRGTARLTGDATGALDLLHGAMIELTDHSRGTGVTYLIEPQIRSATDLLNDVAGALSFIEDFPASAVALEVDTYHAAAQERSITGALVEASLAGRLAHVQVGEVNRRAPRPDGDVPWREVLGVLAALGYDGWVSVEVEQEPSSRAAAEQAQRYLRSLVPPEQP